jgi:hypothetical protein
MNDALELPTKVILLRLSINLSILSAVRVTVGFGGVSEFDIELKYKTRASAFAVELVEFCNVLTADIYGKTHKI